MTRILLRTLILGYGAASIAAATLAAAGGGLLGPMLVVWIGGAAVTLAFAAAAAERADLSAAPAAPVARDSTPSDLDHDLARWRQDQAEEMAALSRPRDAGAPRG
jgi:hypothetical protein